MRPRLTQSSNDPGCGVLPPRDAVAPGADYDRAIPYDEELAQRLRALVADERDLTEQRMFGGLAFLVGGNIAVAVSGQGGLLVRVDPAASDELVATTPAVPMEMRGRSM